MGVDVADQPVVILAPDGVALGVGEEVAGVGVDVGLLRGELLRDGGGGCVHRNILANELSRADTNA